MTDLDLTSEFLTGWLAQHESKLREDHVQAIRFAINDLKVMQQKEAQYSPALRRAYIKNMTKVLDILSGFKSQESAGEG